MAASRVESAISLRSPHSIAKGASKFENDVNKGPMAVSEEATDATKQNVSIIGLELKVAL